MSNFNKPTTLPNDLSKAIPKGEGMAVDYGHGEGYVPPKPAIETTWIEFPVPVYLEEECWEMIKQWLKEKGVME